MWTNEKIPTPSRTRTHRPPGYRPGTTLGGLAWRGQLRWEFYQYYYQLYQLGTGGRSQKDLDCCMHAYDIIIQLNSKRMSLK